MVFDPLDASRIYFASLSGFFVADSDGTKIITSRATLDDLGAPFHLHADPDGRIYYSGGNGLFLSDDRGATWSRDQVGMKAGRFKDLVVNDADSDRVLAAAFQQLFGTNDGGASWKQKMDPSALKVNTNLTGSPTSANTVYSNGSNALVWRSDDFGETWRGLRDGPWDSYSSALAIAISPANSNVIYAGAFGELDVSLDGGKTWTDQDVANNGGPSEQFARIIIEPSDDRRITVITTAAEVWKSDDRGKNWRMTAHDPGGVGLILDVGVDPLNQNTFYVTGRGQSNLAVSYDAGETWAKVPFPRLSAEAVAIDPKDPGTLYVGTMGRPGIVRSVDGGRTWHAMNHGFPDLWGVEALVISADGARMYASTARAQLLTIKRADFPDVPPEDLALGSPPDTATAPVPPGPIFRPTPPLGTRERTATIRPGSRTGLHLRGTSRSDRLRGTPWADIIRGRAGHDVIDGLAGNDQLHGDAGNDRISGGRGNDRIYGGTGNDRLVGGRGSDRIYGGAGNDRINGGAGHDIINGGRGQDRIIGGNGNDRIHTGPGRDHVSGGRGNDRIVIGPGPSRVNAGPGNDIIHARNNARDVIHCGKGRDRVIADRKDVVAKDCEQVLRK